jgi:hypothetical protein
MANHRASLWFGFTTALLLFFGIARVQAAGPQFLITWKTTGSYIPAAYPGKALPTYGSQVRASLMLVSGGKVVNVSGQIIYWYLNGTLLGGGVGAQTISFPPLGNPPNAMTLEADLPNYNGSYLIQTINVPMVEPLAVINSPYPQGQFSQNPVTVTALPYFFTSPSPDTLSYSWSVNNQIGSNSENPEQAQITLPPGTAAGTSFGVTVTINNISPSTQETASTNLIYQPTL